MGRWTLTVGLGFVAAVAAKLAVEERRSSCRVERVDATSSVDPVWPVAPVSLPAPVAPVAAPNIPELSDPPVVAWPEPVIVTPPAPPEPPVFRGDNCPACGMG